MIGSGALLLRSARRARWRAMLVALVAAASVSVAVGGCAAAPAVPITLDDVVAERSAAREAVERARFNAFVVQSAGRLDELGLPLPEFQGVLALDGWDAAVATCIERLDPRLDVSSLDGEFSVNYFGVVGETFERSRWAVDSCEAQYGVADPRAGVTAGVREAAWRYHDATQRVLPCLRDVGVAAPSPPSAVAFIENLGTGREWTPYALVGSDPSTVARVIALCPPSSTLLEAHLAAHVASQTELTRPPEVTR